MVLEATMIRIDNSEWMRNGDYSPTRFQAQAEAVSLLCGSKPQSNPENTVGVLVMAGKGSCFGHSYNLSWQDSGVYVCTLIFTGDGEGGSAFAASAAAAAAGGAAGYEFGADPNLDPALALALRTSMEEERARQEAAARAVEEKGGGQASSSHDAIMTENIGIMSHEANTGDLMDDDTALLEQALKMSLDDHQSIPSGGIPLEDTDMSEATKEDQELALALQMSTQANAEEPTDQSATNQVLGNQAYVSSILSALPGVDTNDDSLKELLASLRGHETEEGR
ncbi:hypothetical protein MKX01_037220 [Papaver californicum]|nr:hypothetical protein MKX01_037220 [Papaver californicum]